MTDTQIGDQLRAIRRAVAFAQSGRAQNPEHWPEEAEVCNAVYRAFGQPLIGEEVTASNNETRYRLHETVKALAGVDWTQR